MTLRFRCGHSARIDPDKTPTPVCACGERRIARVLDAPAPRFTGVATGPHAVTRDLPAMAVSLTTKGADDADE